MKTYDLAVVGAGLAGITAALGAAEGGLETLLLERGVGPGDRRNLVSGWFGRALHTMARIDIGNMSGPARDGALAALRAANGGKLECRQANPAALPDNMVLKPEKRPCYHLAPESGRNMAHGMYGRLSAARGLDILFGAEVERMEAHADSFTLHTRRGRMSASRCVVAVGEHATEWIRSQCASLGLVPASAKARLGVRVEVPGRVLRPLLQLADDLRLVGPDGLLVDDTRVASAVADREDGGLLSALAHSPPGRRPDRASFMVSLDFGDDLDEMTRIVKIVNILCNDKIRHERAADFLEGHSLLKHLGQLDPLRAALPLLDRMMPSFIGNAMVHIPETRFGGLFPTDANMRTALRGLYGAGECAQGVDGLLDAMVSGTLAARSAMEDRDG